MKIDIFLALVLFFVFGSLRLGAEEQTLSAKQIDDFAKAVPVLLEFYKRYEHRHTNDNLEDYIGGMDVDAIVDQLKKNNVYDEFSGVAREVGFSSVESLLNAQKRVLLGVGRLSMQEEFGKPFDLIIAEQSQQMQVMSEMYKEVETGIAKEIVEYQETMKAMSTITSEEIHAIERNRDAMAVFMEDEDEDYDYQ